MAMSFCSSPSSGCTAKGGQWSVLGFPYLIHRSWKRRQHQHSNTVSTKTYQFISYHMRVTYYKIWGRRNLVLLPWFPSVYNVDLLATDLVREQEACMSRWKRGNGLPHKNGTVPLLQGKLTSVHLKHSSILIKMNQF